MRRRFLIIAAVAVAVFAAMAALGLSSSSGAEDPAAAPAAPRVPSGIVVSLNIYPAHQDKPILICPPAGSKKPCEKTAFTYPLRYEACLGSYTGPTACWYVEANAWSRLRRNQAVPSSVSTAAFTAPHSEQYAGPPTGKKVLATKSPKKEER